ncbi:nitroreductase [Desulfopila sp. IMCC35006]|uniref:nitroreductase n=1 Tax=Desulfopila sp. IMCC35006 TaxID=2569542 RepID=UPI0010AD96A3|nr:nitroreductase [Desulfopila sp. IMCC35006]TKB27535.1 nitroreductase [Desulfopila sp. IMCC35006]
MDIIEAIGKRKSIRDFKDDPVPQNVLREILEISCRAPSAMNTQPWEFTVVAKDTLDSMRQAAVDKLTAGEKPRSEHCVAGWPSDSVYRLRQIELAKSLFQLMDIKKEDADKRSQWIERGFRYFNAPAAIIICVDRMLAEGTPIFDIGAVTQTICLTALHYGLGTCIEEQGVMYPDIVRKFCNITEIKQIVIAIAIGYPNWDFPANRLETPRESVDTVTRWCGFE